MIPGCFSGLFQTALLLVFLISSCAKIPNRCNGKQLIPARTTSLKLSGMRDSSSAIFYTGCGGMVIAHRGEALITDPFYTGQNFFRIPGRIRIDPKRTEKVLDSIRIRLIDPRKIQAALIAHAHYDHLLDLPYLLRKNRLNDSLLIVGNASAQSVLRPFIRPADTMNGQTDQWISVAHSIRVMVFKSSHSPHIGKHMFMHGETGPDGIRDLVSPESKTSGFCWKDGGTWSFLVDLLDPEGRPESRIFIQTSASQAPDGFPPDSILRKKPVDVAMLCVASFDKVNQYPDSLLKHLKLPARVILVHWEDFFRKNFIDNPRIIRMSNTRRLIGKLQKIYQAEMLTGLAIMPAPLTLIKLK